MSNVIRFPDKRVRAVTPVDSDRGDRVRCTLEVLREGWPYIFFPFGIVGLVFGWIGFLVGCSIGALFLTLVMLEMRYGEAL